MDTAMRDLNQLRERGDEGTGRKLTVLALAAVVGGAAVFAMGILLGGSREAEAKEERDPLAQLDRAVGEQPPAAAPAPEPVEVAPEDLSFPTALTTDPLVEAAVRAAAAEHAKLDTQHGSGAQGQSPTLPVATPATSALTAGAAASGHGDRLARVAQHDPLVAAALPTSSAQPPAEAGHPGKFTLQVVSYQSRPEANDFAAGLRGRGHRAYVMAADVPGRGRYFRVRIGPFDGRREALDYQRSFESDERMHTLVVRNPDAD